MVFDFDKTIIDCDCDKWVVDEMGAVQLFYELLQLGSLPWNALMSRIMSELHSQGKTIQDIADCMRRIPLHPQIIKAIKSAYAVGCELRIVSDANLFFIETILEHHGLYNCFSEINSNPTTIDEDGKLKIFPYHDFTSSPHGCSFCPPNMCKGLILDRIRASVCMEKEKRFIYLGDGKGDFCPCLRLVDGDYVMPRKNFPLWDLIHKNAVLLKAEVHEWSNGEELERILSQLIDKISMEDDNSTQLPSLDCMSQTVPIPSPEDLPRPSIFLINHVGPPAGLEHPNSSH